jgi:hypothetical protein
MIHYACDRVVPVNQEESGSIRFFCVQAVGIMIEDGAQELYRRIYGKATANSGSPLWTKLVGYIWVVAFLTWSTPAWIYPHLRHWNRDDLPTNLNSWLGFLPSLPVKIW